MNKMAIFVEGYTEMVFADKLVCEIANNNSVAIEKKKISGGSTCPRKITMIQAAALDGGQEHFVIIYDCGGDRLVKNRMMEEYHNLANAGYSKIVCIRDVCPGFTYSEIAKLESNLPRYVETSPIAVDFILSVMEVEAWFLAEHGHFAKIDPSITVQSISAALHFDPSVDDMRMRPTPATDLNECYQIAGKTYRKKNAKATVDALDFAVVYVSLVEKFPYLKNLCNSITAFLTS